MSRTILYDRLFIALPDKKSYIALVLSGDSNVWTRGTGNRLKRSRSWTGFDFGEKKLSYSREEIETYLDELLVSQVQNVMSDSPGKSFDEARADVNRNFGYHSGISLYGRKQTSWNSFREFFVSGLNHAVPIDQYFKVANGLYVSWYGDDGETRGFHRTRHVVAFDELVQKWNDIANRPNEGFWIKPSSEIGVSSLSAFLSTLSSGKCRNETAFKLTIKRPDEAMTEGYLSSIFPLALSDNKKDAVRFNERMVTNSSPSFHRLMWGMVEADKETSLVRMTFAKL